MITKLNRKICECVLGASLAILATACGGGEDAPEGPAEAYVTDGSNLRGLRLDAPSKAIGTVAITGLQAGEQLRGLDFRPANGELWAISNQARLYVIDPASGAAIQRGADNAFALGATDDIGFDFNPVPDRIRVVGRDGQNLRLNPNDGSLAGTDGNINGAATSLRSAAYTNSFLGAAPMATTLFVTEYSNGGAMLFMQNPPNAGMTIAVGAMDLGAPLAGSMNFDIRAPASGFVSVNRGNGTAAQLYSVEVGTGATSLIGSFDGLSEVKGFAILPVPAI